MAAATTPVVEGPQRGSLRHPGVPQPLPNAPPWHPPTDRLLLWFELTAMSDDWAMALDEQPFFVQALVDTLPRVAQLHADEEFIQRLVKEARC